MTESLPHDNVHTHVVSDALRRFGLRIAFAVIVIGAAVGGYAYLGPHTYQATSSVLIRPLSGNALSTQTSTSSQSSTVAMETEASLVTSLAVTQRVNDALDTDLRSGGGGVSSKVPPNSQIVQITYVARTARDAQRRAQAFAQAFLDYRSDLATQAQKAQLDRLNARAALVSRQLQQALKDKASKNPPEDADTRVRLFTSNFASLQSEIGQVQSAGTEPGNIVTPAALPGAPTGLSPVLLTAGGALVALIVAAAIAIWRERTDDRIRAPAEVTMRGVPVLAVLPDADSRARRAAKRAVPDPARAEALRRARTSLLAVTPLDSVIAIAGLSDGEPAVATAVDLAGALAVAGYRVTLVDAASADEARPSRLTGGAGLSDVLSTNDAVPAELPLRDVDGVQVLGAGGDPAAASEKYAGHRTRLLLQRLQEGADYVLVATAPADVSEGMAMLLAADGVVLIATDRVSTHAQLAATTTAAQRLGATVLGIVVRQGSGERRNGGKGRKGVGQSAAPAATEDDRSPEAARIESRKRAQHSTRRSRDQVAAGTGTAADAGVGIMDDPDPEDSDTDGGREKTAADTQTSAFEKATPDEFTPADMQLDDQRPDERPDGVAPGEGQEDGPADDRDAVLAGADDEPDGGSDHEPDGGSDDEPDGGSDDEPDGGIDDEPDDQPDDQPDAAMAVEDGDDLTDSAAGTNLTTHVDGTDRTTQVDGAPARVPTPADSAVNHQGLGMPAGAGRQRKRIRNRRNAARIANRGMGGRSEQDG